MTARWSSRRSRSGDAPLSLFWLLDALTAAGVPDALQSSLFWPLIAGSVAATELTSAIGLAAAKMAPPTTATALSFVALVAAPLAVKAAAK